MPDLVVIVPSKGRPLSLLAVVEAWLATDAYADADLVFAVDSDDPTLRAYHMQPLPRADIGRPLVQFVYAPHWMPMVHKLNLVAVAAATMHLEDDADRYPMIGFAGDDHRPRSKGWAARYVGELRRLGTGIVYGDDRVQGAKLPTQWAMTADIVAALGRMVPANVEHLYCDNSILDLGRAIDRISYLPDVVIEHCHPVAGRGPWDAGYQRVNSRDQYARDHAAYTAWGNQGLRADAARILDHIGATAAA